MHRSRLRRPGSPARAPLDRERLRVAVEQLAAQDADLAEVRRRFGPPPLWARRPGFSALVRIILEQQVSLASARAAFERLRGAVDRLSPRSFLRLDGSTLRRIGFSRQKAAYCRSLARALVDGDLRLVDLTQLDDERALARLTGLRGVGPWTADIYLLMALRRPDVWPRGDLALARAAQRVKRLRRLPSQDELAAIAEGWRPWRSAAARLLWHDYLSRRRALVRGRVSRRSPG